MAVSARSPPDMRLMLCRCLPRGLAAISISHSSGSSPTMRSSASPPSNNVLKMSRKCSWTLTKVSEKSWLAVTLIFSIASSSWTRALVLVQQLGQLGVLETPAARLLLRRLHGRAQSCEALLQLDDALALARLALEQAGEPR